MKLSRAQVIAYRVAAQGLHRQGSEARGLAVLDIGVQDSGSDGARLALDARLKATPPADGIGPGKPLALAWSLRGAPHVHRRRDLDSLAAALWPLSEADATGRLNETGPSVARAGIAALDQYAIAVDAMRAVVTAPMGKGAASTAVTKRIPPQMRRNCRVCKAHHISDSAMRPAALGAGLELEPGTSPPVLLPRSKARAATGPDVAAMRKLIIAYLRLLGPATSGDVAGYFDARRADIEQIWPAKLVEVTVDGRTSWLPAAVVDEVRSAQPADVVRLLGPFDPYLQARDRHLIVPDVSVHKALWPVLGRPGVIFADGEAVGTWRTKAAGPTLTITVQEFVPLPPSVRARIDDEAERVAGVRGATEVRVRG
ncbi:MAG TPA: crosslink repair DNA glycosylase YcaQ family protein [Jatrophihabitantaceae bacterium]|nr:crosslink repair DNA glycosylase YcaQ family protein [Jatrophihabitantaceae bacterium]